MLNRRHIVESERMLKKGREREGVREGRDTGRREGERERERERERESASKV